MHDLRTADRFDAISADREEETRTLSKLLALCDDLGIRVTFDVVGHLFLEEWSGHHESPHRPG